MSDVLCFGLYLKLWIKPVSIELVYHKGLLDQSPHQCIWKKTSVWSFLLELDNRNDPIWDQNTTTNH